MASAASTRSDSTSSKQQDEPTSNRRRRGAGIVTPNACTECRRKRAKCDGKTPCQRCATNDTPCVYEVQVRMSKDTMRSEIEQLQKYRNQSERLLAFIVSDGVDIQSIVKRLRDGQSLEQVSRDLGEESTNVVASHTNVTIYENKEAQDAVEKRLQFPLDSAPSTAGFDREVASRSNSLHNTPNSRQQSQEDRMRWTAESDSEAKHQSPFEKSSPETKRARDLGQTHLLESYSEEGTEISDVSIWTTVTDNPGLVEHLMALYFCWEYPTFATMSKEHFLQDFRAGRKRYCSSTLVNAMLALACRFSSIPETRTHADNPETAGDHFFAEAKRLLDEADRSALTTIQALGLMSIREVSCGRDLYSYYLSGQAIRLCVETGLHRPVGTEDADRDSVEEEVRSATFWGAFSLDTAFSLTMGQPPHISLRADLIKKPSTIDAIEESEWLPYTDDGVPFHRSVAQPSNVRSVFKCFADLAEVVHRAIYTVYTPGRTVTSAEVVAAYYRYLKWYNSLTEVLRLGTNFTPAVLFAHMYYHFAILSLLRPFVKLRFIGTGVSPRDVCAQAADAITTLIRSYDNLYSLKRTPSFVPFIALSSSVMHLFIQSTLRLTEFDVPQIPVDANPNLKQQIMQSAKDLDSMSSCHGFARRALDIIKYLARIWQLPEMVSDALHDSGDQATTSSSQMVFGPKPSSSSDEQSGNHNETSEMCIESLEELARRLYRTSSGSTAFFPRAAIEDTSSPRSRTLFSPFAMQGVPAIALNERLSEHGYQWLMQERDDGLKGDVEMQD